MHENKNGLEGEASHSQPKGSINESVRGPLQKNKMLAVVFQDYIKLYADSYTQLQVVSVADCSRVSSELILKAESLAIELAEAEVPLTHRHLWDERLLVNTICSRAPTVEQLAHFESLRYGLNVIDNAVRNSHRKRRAS